MIEVVDRVSTYPGRIRLIPVAGQDGVYDMVRADEPTVVGTVVDKALFDSIVADISGKLSLKGGTMTGPLVVNGGDGSTASKISFANGKGQITNSQTGTLFGYIASNNLAVGHSSCTLSMRGSAARPTYNGNDVALTSDLSGTHDHSGAVISPVAMELHPGSGSGHGGYIDFHYNGSTEDFTSRILEANNGLLQINAPSGVVVSDVGVGGYHARNIMASATDITSGSAMTSGQIYLVYE